MACLSRSMAKNIMLRIRISRQEYDRIRAIAQARGHSTISSFIRSVALERDLWMEKRIQEIYTILKDVQKTTRQPPQQLI